MAGIPMATEPPAMGITLMRNTLTIGRTLTPDIRAMRITNSVPGAQCDTGSPVRAALVSANAAAAFPH